MKHDSRTLGVDLGGTKIEVAWVDSEGKIGSRTRKPTLVEKGAEDIIGEIIQATRQLLKEFGQKAARHRSWRGRTGRKGDRKGEVRPQPRLA